MRQLLTEGVLVALLGGGLGVGLAAISLRLVERVQFPLPVAGEIVETPMPVVGVARDRKYTSLGEDPTPFVFCPASHLLEAEMNVLVRSGGNPTALVAGIRQAVAALDAGLPVYDVRTLEQHVGLSLFPVRAVAWLLGARGAFALLPAGIGLYGVLAHNVARRTREIGIRMAVGATERNVMAAVVGGALRLPLIGAALGLAAAFRVTRFLGFLLCGVSPLDPATFAGMLILRAAVCVAAAAVPARRAARVDPFAALRAEWAGVRDRNRTRPCRTRASASARACSLLLPERDDWIHPRRTPGRYQRRADTGGHEHDRDEQVHRRTEGLDDRDLPFPQTEQGAPPTAVRSPRRATALERTPARMRA